MDYSSNVNSNIGESADNNDLVNFVEKSTRICKRFYKKTNTTKCSSTLIDLLLHNGDLVDETDQLFKKKESTVLKEISCRNLSSENLLKINSAIEKIDFKQIRIFDVINYKWKFVKEEITKVMDEIAPIRKITLKNPNQFAWYDDDLMRLKHQKDSSYKQYVRSNSLIDKEIYDKFNISIKKLNEDKLIDYFKDKPINDFKSSKKFRQYYSSKIKIKSEKSNSNPISHVKYNGKSSEDKTDLCNIFNVFFTSISSSSECSKSEASDFIEKEITTIPSQSGPGIIEIPTKIFKSSSVKLRTTLAYLFKYAVLTNNIPNEWKAAVVTPLFKKKGSSEDLNSYGGISIHNNNFISGTNMDLELITVVNLHSMK
ncbi:unnamed protein product [Brachionus calyciflorus]|uniref:Uncharacterized protein n=1 Tax=Brachionus calyciflorus TaxID=104777 RepID=A0A813SKI7_9BILA|nr:unnamed protein product [Brachionus calyciflorus]